MAMYDTIIAISTPIGESAVGVLRLSGSEAIGYCSKILNKSNALQNQTSYTIKYYRIIDPETLDIIDDTLITVFKSPHSYTGEDIVEISCHGSPFILKKVFNIFLKLGVRPAEPGEFTERAYLNGKMDLTQAEAVNDLIRAHTEFARLSAQNQIQGKFSGIISNIHSKILDLLSQIEAGIDHSDLDEIFIDAMEIKDRIMNIREEIFTLLKTAVTGKITREGIKIAIIGAPNTGKSSLMNYLLQEDRVIVSEIPGTTRDLIEEELNISGISVRISDTAGIQDTNDVLEIKGIERTKKAIRESDLRIMLFDSSRMISPDDEMIFHMVKDLKCIYVLNKRDLPEIITGNIIYKKFNIKAIPVSIIDKNGIDLIEKAIVDFYYSFGFNPARDVLVTNARQEELLNKTERYLFKALSALDHNLSEEFIASDIRKALISIEEITGKSSDDEVLKRIFSKFCIGK